MSAVKLIVNADDFARSRGVDRGILEAHSRGVVTSTTAMMNLDDAVLTVKAAHERYPALGLGVHLNITFGTPLNPPGKVASLVEDDGRFRNHRSLFTDPISIRLSDVEREWRLQIERFLQTGVPLDHLDSHHHIAVTTPAMFELFLDLATDYSCGVRNPCPQDSHASDLSALYPENVVQFVRTEAGGMMQQRSIHHPDHFLASFFGQGATLDHLCHLIDNLSSGSYEIMCHPGSLDKELSQDSSYTIAREQELKVLTDSRIRSLIADRAIELHTFQSAWPA